MAVLWAMSLPGLVVLLPNRIDLDGCTARLALLRAGGARPAD